MQTGLAQESNSSSVKLVFAANIPDITRDNIGNYGQLYTLLKQLRQKEKSTIFAFGGGSLGPSPMSSFDRGAHIVDILNTLEPDLMTARKREFSFFEDELSLRSFEAAFPIVVSNVTDQLTNQVLEGLQENILVEKNNHKIGFISILESDVVQEYILKRINVVESRSIIERQSQKLKLQGAEAIVMVYSKTQPYYKELLDAGVIDIAINARSTSDNSAPNMLLHPHSFSLSRNGKALILDLNWLQTDTKKPSISHIEVDLQDYAEDPTVALQVTNYSHRLDRLLNQKIGTLTTPINTLYNSVRTEENAFANLITDIIKDHENADICIINGGSIRGDKEYKANTAITRRDIATELPFRGRVTLVSATGQQIKDALEHGLSEIELVRGRFPHVSGITFSFSANAPVGQRIQEIIYQGEELDLNKSYTVATSSYLANGGDGFSTLSNKLTDNILESSRPLVSDIVIRNIQKSQNISPKLESRIVRVN